MNSPRYRFAPTLLLIPFLVVQANAAPQDDKDILKKLKAGPQNGPGFFETTKVKRKDKKGVEREVEQRRTRSGDVAKSKKAAFVIEDVVELLVPASPEEAKKLDGTDAATIGSHGSVEFYDEAGSLKWKKTLASQKTAMHPRRISNGGEIVSVIESCEMNCRSLPADQPNNQLVVWDTSGKELIRFPKTRGACAVSSTNHWVSVDGHYVLASCTVRGGVPSSIIIDVRAKKMWRSPGLLDVVVSMPLGPKKIVAQMTDEKLKGKTVELDLEKLAWEALE